MTANMRNTALWSAARNWGTRLGSVVVFLVLARILSTHQLGLFSATIALLAIAELFAENGIGDAVVQASEIDDDVLTAALLLNAGLGVVLALVAVIFSAQIEAYFGAKGLAPLLSVAALSVVLNAFSYVPQSVFRRRFQYRWLAVRAMIATVISGAIGIVLAIGGLGAWSMVAQAIAFAVVNLVMVWSRPPFNPFVRPAFGRTMPLLRFGSTLLVGRLLYYLTTRMIELVLLHKFGPALLSLYIMGSRIYFVATQLLTAVIVDVSFSSFSRLADDREKLLEAILRTMRTAAIVTTPVFLGLSALSPELCHVAFGSKGPAAAPFLGLIAVFGIMHVPQHFFGTTLAALGRPAVATMLMGLQAAISCAILLPDWGGDALTLVGANSAAVLVAAPLALFVCARIGGFPIAPVLRAVLPVYLAGALMWGAIFVARIPLLPTLRSPFLRGAVLGAAGGATYLLCLAIVAPDLLRVVRSYRVRRIAR
jgi:O-antigen/teichoic acid export membrane protein